MSEFTLCYLQSPEISFNFELKWIEFAFESS